MRGEFGASEEDKGKKCVIFKVVFKNNIGKILYDCNISGAVSKLRKIEEKSFKNQLKIAVCRAHEKKQQLHYCLINFGRSEDMDQFKTHFEAAV